MGYLEIDSVVLADLHVTHYDETGGPNGNGCPTIPIALGGTRKYGSWDSRETEFETYVNTLSGIDRMFLMGDPVDGATTESLKRGLFQAYLARMDALGIPYHELLGNHMTTWDGTGDNPTLADYFDDLIASSGHVTPQNILNDSVNSFESFTEDVNGIRIINLLNAANRVSDGTPGAYIDNPTEQDHLQWVQDRLDETNATNMPTILLSHAPSWKITTDIKTSFFLTPESHADEMNAIILANPQLIFAGCGHWHKGVTESPNNGYIGNCLCFNFMGSTWTGQDVPHNSDDINSDLSLDAAAFYRMKIKAKPFGIPNTKANIEITGFRSLTVDDSIAFERFLIA